MREYTRRRPLVVGAAVGVVRPEPALARLRDMPLPPNLADYVKDEDPASAFGKALFWDQTAGRDGMACASCHTPTGDTPS
jgi:cytochrome c peroxidase